MSISQYWRKANEVFWSRTGSSSVASRRRPPPMYVPRGYYRESARSWATTLCMHKEGMSNDWLGRVGTRLLLLHPAARPHFVALSSVSNPWSKNNEQATYLRRQATSLLICQHGDTMALVRLGSAASRTMLASSACTKLNCKRSVHVEAAVEQSDQRGALSSPCDTHDARSQAPRRAAHAPYESSSKQSAAPSQLTRHSTVILGFTWAPSLPSLLHCNCKPTSPQFTITWQLASSV